LTVKRALIGGLGDVVRAPRLIVASFVAMLAVAVPFAATLGARLQQSLSHRQPVMQHAIEIDADWWQEFLEHADGLAATFTPRILGFAAPLDNLSAVLDGTQRRLILIIPIALAMVTWAFIWGAALDRFAHRGQSSTIWRAGARTLLPFIAISALTAALVLLLYYTVHPLLFGVIADRWQMGAATERGVFARRAVLYAIFGSLLAAISIVADYARIQVALAPRMPVTAAIREAWTFVRKHAGPVCGLYLATGALFVLLLATYLAVEIVGDFHVGGWRGIAIAQAYIIARIVIRLTFGASELRLYRALASDHKMPLAPAAIPRE
jgi:hypothetical protein